jgi:PhnB protein
MPMAVQFWGDYFGMLTDQFGINWMIDHNGNRV